MIQAKRKATCAEGSPSRRVQDVLEEFKEGGCVYNRELGEGIVRKGAKEGGRESFRLSQAGSCLLFLTGSTMRNKLHAVILMLTIDIAIWYFYCIPFYSTLKKHSGGNPQSFYDPLMAPVLQFGKKKILQIMLDILMFHWWGHNQFCFLGRNEQTAVDQNECRKTLTDERWQLGLGWWQRQSQSTHWDIILFNLISPVRYMGNWTRAF